MASGSVLYLQTPESSPHFLSLPFSDSSIKMQQGMRYEHGPIHPPGGAFDYVKVDPNDSATWQAFDVIPAAPGVACWDTESGYGNLVIIRHDEKDSENRNYFTIYAHLEAGTINSDIPKLERQNTDYHLWKRVSTNDILGRAGATGRTCESPCIHLHFEVRLGSYRGTVLDPYDISNPSGNLFYKRDKYPGGANFSGCGTNYLWTNCPGASPTPSGDFTISAAPLTHTIKQGDSTAYTVVLRSRDGFSGPINLRALDLPTGYIASNTRWNPASVNLPPDGQVSSIFTIATSASTQTGRSIITLEGTSGSLTRRNVVTLTINTLATCGAFISFVEGNPGLPGDGVLISGAGGRFPGSFTLSRPLSIAEVGGGLTFTVFLPPSARPPSIGEQVFSFGISSLNRPAPCQSFVGVSTNYSIGKVQFNGVEGIFTNLSGELVAGYLGRINSIVPGCNFSANELFITEVYLIGGTASTTINALDSVTICLGQNNYPGIRIR